MDRNRRIIIPIVALFAVSTGLLFGDTVPPVSVTVPVAQKNSYTLYEMDGNAVVQGTTMCVFPGAHTFKYRANNVDPWVVMEPKPNPTLPFSVTIDAKQMGSSPTIGHVKFHNPNGKEDDFPGTVTVTVPSVNLKLLYETKNKANQIFNPTRKDDPRGDPAKDPGSKPDSNGDTYGTLRNILYLVSDPADNRYKATVEADIQPDCIRPKFFAAVFTGGTKVAGSDKGFDVKGKCNLEFKHSGSAINDFVLRVGFDANSNSQLDPREVLPFVVKNTATGKTLGDPTIRGTSGTRYTAAKNSVDDIVDGNWTSPGWLTSLVLPHAKRLLQIFRDGNASGVPTDKQPTSSSTVTLNAFTGYFAEWLTHNSGAPFDDSGKATLTEYSWNKDTSLADLVATAPQVKRATSTFYNQTVSPIVTAYFTSLPIGSVADFPSATTFFSVTHTSESPSWVSPYTTTFNTWLPDRFDDVNGTIGRGRLLTHQARYRVEKREALLGSKLVVTSVESKGEVIDLYDFNHDVGGAAQDAAILQIGYGKGSYGSSRNRGKIFRDRIQFDKLHTELP